jgi:hypothetical protein
VKASAPIGICVGTSGLRHLEKTLATRTAVDRSGAHRGACGLRRDDEDDCSAARAGRRQRDAYRRECASWSDAEFYGERNGYNESECELVGEWSCRRECDDRDN